MPQQSQLPDELYFNESTGLSLAGRRILVINPSQSLPPALRGMQGAEVTVAQLSMIDVQLLAQVAPDVVLAPLFSTDHDILDLACLLDRAGYTGPLRAWSAPLPDSALVRAEVRQIWGTRDFDILEVPRQLN